MNVSDEENRKKYDEYLKTRKLIRQEVDRQIKEMDINEILAELERLMIKETTEEWIIDDILQYGTDEQRVRLKIDYGWELL
jgi:heme oxygenase